MKVILINILMHTDLVSNVEHSSYTIEFIRQMTRNITAAKS